MSASAIFDLAPLGALVRYSDGAPRPPERHVNKLRAWKRKNGQGRLVEKSAAHRVGALEMPATITVHEGDYTSEGVVVLSVRGIHAVTSSLTFEVVGLPPPGSVMCLVDRADTVELVHLAPSRAAATAWAARSGYSQARFEMMGAGGEPAPVSLAAEAA